MSLKKFTSGERLLASDLNSMVDQIEANISMIETTWSNLKTLRDSSKLIPGATYRITDYTCTTTQEGTQSAGHVFDILVTADDVNVLNENAHAIQHKEEVITVPYPTMDVDGTSYYLWTKYVGGEETTYQILTSTLDINCSLDNPYEPNAWLNSGEEYISESKNDKFVYLENNNGVYRLYKTDFNDFPDEVDRGDYFECSNKIKTYFENSDLSAWELKYCLDNDTTRFKWADSSSAGRGVIYYMKDEFNNECPYDFKNIQFKLVKLSSITWNDNASSDLQSSYEVQFVGNYVGNWFTVNNAGTANLNTGDTTYTYTFSGALDVDGTVEGTMGRFGNNTIEPCYNEGTYSMLLNHIVIMDNDGNDADNMASNKFGVNCYNIFVYGNSFYNNTFVNSCRNNTFGNSCYENTFVNSCSRNTFGNECYSNTFGNNCSNNTFVNSCSNNTFGNDCRSNTFGNSCSDNIFGNVFLSNTFGNDCKSNTFGNSCKSNTFGNDCRSNTFGNDCTNNTFRNDCTSNTFGEDCYNNTFGSAFLYNTFGNNCYHNTFVNTCNSNTFGNSCSNNTFGSAFFYNTFGNYCQYNTFGNDYIQYCTFFEGVAYLNVSITASNTNKLQNMQVLNCTQGTSDSKLQITGSTYVTAGRAYTTTIGMNSSGTLTSKVLMDA